MPAATAADLELGNDELFYVATTAPTTASDKDDAAYKLAGLQTSFTYSVQGQTIEIRGKTATSTKAGSNTRTATLGLNTSFVSDDAQTIMVNAAESESPKTTVYGLVTSGVSGDRYRYFTAEVSSMNDQSPTDAAATIEFGLAIQGAVTTGFLA